MSNFLSNLISHALGVPSTIQARLPSPYETKGSKENRLETSEEQYVGLKPAQRDVAETRVEAISAAERTPQEAGISISLAGAVKEQERRQSAAPDTIRVERAEPGRNRFESSEPPQRADFDEATVRWSPSLRPSPDEISPRMIRDTVFPSVAQEQIHEARNAGNVIAASDMQAPVDSQIESRMQTPDLPSVHKFQPPAPEKVMQQSRPSIKITIGRVDVRAVMTLAPAGPRNVSTPSTQTLTLQEYLRQREQGKR